MRFIEGRNDCLVILDGDKRNANDSNVNKIAKYSESSTDAEKERAREWGAARITYLPGDTWPEKWLIDVTQIQADKTYLIEHWGVESESQIEQALEAALLAGKHNEFFQLGHEISQDKDQVRADVIRFVKRAQGNHLGDLIAKISQILAAHV